MRRSVLTAKAWWSYLLLGLLAVGVYYVMPAQGPGLFGRVVVYCGTSGSAAVAVLYGMLRNRPRSMVPWLLIGLSQVVYAAADTSFYIAHDLMRITVYPSIADVLYLGHYPLMIAGLVLLIRRRSPGRDLPTLLDAGMLAVALAMLSWLYLIAPQARSGMPALAKAASVAYPVMDLALLAVALGLILGGGRRPPSFVLLLVNLSAILTADTCYVLQQLAGTYRVGNFLDAIWLGGNLALGAAALHPTMVQLDERSHTRGGNLGWARIAMLCVAALVAPAVLLIRNAQDSLRNVPVVAGASAVLIMLAIARLAGLVAEQRRLAITDALTGLRTRRFFETQLSWEVAHAQRCGGSLAVLIVDVDRFKSINDRHGHPAGDRVLIEIADRLRRQVRSGDLVARYGGEEFVLLLPDACPDELPAVAERLRRCVADTPVQTPDKVRTGVTVSVGVAILPLHGDSPAELVEAADRALYDAKALGRDQVVVGETFALPSTLGHGRETLIEYLCWIADQVDMCLSSHEHSRAIGRWAPVLAAELGLDEVAVCCSALAGRLHDIGKILVPKTILGKPTELSDKEWQQLRQHPDHGFQLASAVPGLHDVAQVIRQHHERYDGSGYPRGLARDEIRLEARLITVCDSWAAMRSDRWYQPSLSEDEAREQLILGRGSQFDPAVTDLFLDLHKRGMVGELGRLCPESAPPALSRLRAHR